jgi:MFS family permease
MARAAVARPTGMRYDYKISKVIFASSAGTMIEWYDFYIFGVLAASVLPAVFFSNTANPVQGLLLTLGTFWTGFLVRPFGAAVFGRIGDIIGRKFTFVITISIMGVSTFLIGLLPSYASIGILAPILLILLRILQGLALGGEYGGAAIYVAEHAPDERRGYFTSFIQTTATLGLLLALIVIVGIQLLVGETAFASWGWRIPFLLSAVLVGISLYIRLSLRETPLFSKLKEEKKTSKSPIVDSFKGGAWKLMLLALLGATAGQAVVWYTGQFYALTFLQSTLGLELLPASVIVGVALVLATPFFLFFGNLSDKIGRKPIILGGCLIAAITYIPIYQAMTNLAANYVALTLLVFIQVVYVTMVYGPIAAFLVELFPTSVRYTSLSLPYHIGNGWFGGGVPFIATFIVERTGSSLSGLAYPIGVSVMTAVVGFFLIKETKDVRIWDDVDVAMKTAVGGEIELEEEKERAREHSRRS